MRSQGSWVRIPPSAPFSRHEKALWLYVRRLSFWAICANFIFCVTRCLSPTLGFSAEVVAVLLSADLGVRVAVGPCVSADHAPTGPTLSLVDWVALCCHTHILLIPVGLVVVRSAGPGGMPKSYLGLSPERSWR